MLGALCSQILMPAASSSSMTTGFLEPLSSFKVAFYPLAGKWSKLHLSALELLTMASILCFMSVTKRKDISEQALPYPQVQVLR